jgi:hypothetical protein
VDGPQIAFPGCAATFPSVRSRRPALQRDVPTYPHEPSLGYAALQHARPRSGKNLERVV